MQKPKSIKQKFFRLFCIISGTLVLMFSLVATVIYLIKPHFFENIINIILLAGGYSVISVACLTWAYNEYSEKVWNMVTNDIRKGMKAVEDGNYDYRINNYLEEETVPLAMAFNEMTRKLCDNEKELENQNTKISVQNDEIINANKELYESYKKLTDTYNMLNESEQKYFSLVNNIKDLICVVKFDGTIYFVNDSIKNVLGFTKEEVEGRKIYEVMKGKDSLTLLDKIGNRLTTRNGMNVNLKLKKKNGELIEAKIAISLFKLAGKDIGIQAIIRDVTKQNQMEKQLLTTNNELCIVNDISKKLNVSLELESILGIVVKQITTILQIPFCYFSLLNTKNNEFEGSAYSGDYADPKMIKKYGLAKFNLKDTIIQKMFKDVDPIIVTDFSFSPLIQEMNKNGKSKIKEIVLVPVKIKNKSIGVLSVCSTVKVTESQINLLSSISNNVAIAIENAMLYESMKDYFIKTIDSLVAAIEAKDKYTEGHSLRVSEYAVKIAKKLSLSKSEIEQVRIAGILHDVGKIGIPDNILNKPSGLTKQEFEEIKRHPLISNKIIENVGLPVSTIDSITMHHERYDGGGYPYGKKGDEIPKGAQIIAVADSLDAMISKRAYRDPMPISKAISELEKGKGKQFNPKIVEALEDVLKVEKRVE